MINSHRAALSCAEFNGERIVEHHMERMGGKEQLLEQMYSAMATKRDDTVDLALRSYGAHCHCSACGNANYLQPLLTVPFCSLCWLLSHTGVLCEKHDVERLSAWWRS